MKIKTLLPLICFFAILSFSCPDVFAGNLKITELPLKETRVKTYSPVSMELKIADGSAKNDISISATVLLPDGTTKECPAFDTGNDSLWKILYSPSIPGKYRYHIDGVRGADSYHGKEKTFDATKSDYKGFIHKDPSNPLIPRFSSGKTFTGFGYNIAWVNSNSEREYEKYFTAFRENGLNLTRIWINTSWGLNVETGRLGEYNYPDLDKLDRIVSMAERSGIYIVLCLDTYGALMDTPGDWNEGSWNINPYNKANGGPCVLPWDFFTNDEAKKYFKKRLAYLVARYSHSTSILAFELWNETDTPPEWAEEMTEYIKGINPHGQMVTVSLGYPWGNNFDESAIWSLEGIDMIERHIYGNQHKDAALAVITINSLFAGLYSKPLLVGEFGINAGKDDRQSDPERNAVELHNSLWASIFSGSFATSLNWWWQGYAGTESIYPHYRAISEFFKECDLSSVKVLPWQDIPLRLSPAKDLPDGLEDISVPTFELWGEQQFRAFTIMNNGDVSGGYINHYLQSCFNKKLGIEPAFNVDYPADGEFILNIGLVSQGACVEILMDDILALSECLPAGRGEGPWQRSLFRKDQKIYQCVYNMPLSIKVPKGKHVIKLRNSGMDWAGIKSIKLTNYKDQSFANARMTGLETSEGYLIWIQNRDFNWKKTKNGSEPGMITGSYFTLPVDKQGEHSIEWWDTFSGKIIKTDTAIASDGIIKVMIPPFSKDIACKIKK